MKKQEKNTALELEAFVKEKGVQFGKFVSGSAALDRIL